VSVIVKRALQRCDDNARGDDPTEATTAIPVSLAAWATVVGGIV
jgi:hypothetical protein